MVLSHKELLDIDELLRPPHPQHNHARQVRAGALWSAAKMERKQGNLELADCLKTAGDKLLARNLAALSTKR